MNTTWKKISAWLLLICLVATGFGMPDKTALAAENTTVYFLNNRGWEQVYAYVYANGTTVGTEWPGVEAEAAPEIGENWWKTTVGKDGTTEEFNIIFNNNAGTQFDGHVSRSEDNYMTTEDAVYSSAADAQAVADAQEPPEEGETTVYFLNSKGWESLGAYAYGQGEPLGSWPGVTPEAASEVGEAWYKVTVPVVPKFNIIFFYTEEDSKRAELPIPSADYVYVTPDAQVYQSALAAELSQGLGDLSLTTSVYFYNNQGWDTISGYTFIERDGQGISLGAGWPGTTAQEASEIGEHWWKIIVPMIPSEEETFKVIFTDGLNQTEDVEITNQESVYVIPSSAVYNNPEEAAEAAGAAGAGDNDTTPNADADCAFAYDGYGAAVPYVTYEAEAAQTNAEVLPFDTTYVKAIQSEASQRQAVKLNQTGDYVTFTLTEDTNALVLRYSMPDSADGAGLDDTLSLYVNGSKVRDLNVTSRHAWIYGSYPYTNQVSQGEPHRYFDETRLLLDTVLRAGTTVTLQKDASDTADFYVIDFIEGELAGAPLTQPENSLSVTEFGAVPNDGTDDRAAFDACIAAAKEQGKEVWIPAGTFDLTEKVPFELTDVIIRGAGMWYTNLNGAGVSFHYTGTCKFYDFAMNGVATVRDDSGDLAAFEGSGKNNAVTIQNIWVEHTKVGVWSYNSTNLVVQGCRIRNTYADGINLCSGTHNALIRNNNLRNNGDDCIAIWPWLADCTDNTIAHNTVQFPTLANGIAIYGGSGNTAEYNRSVDMVNHGAGICVGSEFATKKGFTGTTTVRNNLVERSGSYHTGSQYELGAIWFWSSSTPMDAEFIVTDNVLQDCCYSGVLFESRNTLDRITMTRNKINGCTNAIAVRGTASGSAYVGGLEVENMTGELVYNPNENFLINWIETEEPSSEGENTPSQEDETPTETPKNETDLSDGEAAETGEPDNYMVYLSVLLLAGMGAGATQWKRRRG